jgi:hypothetical protein
MEAFMPCGRPLVAWPRSLLESKSRRFHAFSDTGADRGCSRLNTRVDPLHVRQL